MIILKLLCMISEIKQMNSYIILEFQHSSCLEIQDSPCGRKEVQLKIKEVRQESEWEIAASISLGCYIT